MAIEWVSIAAAFIHISPPPTPFLLPHCFLLALPQRPPEGLDRMLGDSPPSKIADLQTKFALQASSSHSRIKTAFPSSADQTASGMNTPPPAV